MYRYYVIIQCCLLLLYLESTKQSHQNSVILYIFLQLQLLMQISQHHIQKRLPAQLYPSKTSEDIGSMDQQYLPGDEPDGSAKGVV